MVLSQITLIIEDFNSRNLQLDEVVEIDLTEAMSMFTPSTKEESVFSTLSNVIKVTKDISLTILATSRKNTMTTRGEEVVRCVVAEEEETSMLAIISTLPSTLEIITTTRPTSPDKTIIKSRMIVDIITMTSSLHVEATLVVEECAQCLIINPNLKCMSVGSTWESRSVVSLMFMWESLPLGREKVT
jgi:hypothetical protein